MDDPRDQRLERLRDSADRWMPAEDPGIEMGAMIETAFLMAAADGDVSPEEHEQLVATIGQVTEAQFPREQLRAMTDQLAEALRADGWDTRIATVAQNLRDPIARRNAYRLAAGVSFIDGAVQEHEAQLFGLLADAFQIPADEASTILAEVRDYLFGSADASGTTG